MKKEEFLKRLRSKQVTPFDMPAIDINPLTFDDVKRKFIETSEAVGGQVIEAAVGDDLNAIIRQAYPNAKRFASNVAGISADINPDSVAEAADLDGTDVGIVQGALGIAENGCIWVPQTMKEKAVCFIAENLVILLSSKALVSNMHEAYRRIEMTDYGFGTFISGPSKTADIEQALVMGAQASRSTTIVLIDEDKKL